MSVSPIVGLVLVVLCIIVMGWIIVRLMGNVAYLIKHESAHCEQIGELQQHVATLALVLNNATATPLPHELMEYATRVRDE